MLFQTTKTFSSAEHKKAFQSTAFAHTTLLIFTVLKESHPTLIFTLIMPLKSTEKLVIPVNINHMI